MYYDIGLNLFCHQFKDPEHILANAAKAEVKCILTGSDMKENELVNDFTKGHDCFGTAGIHPHNADDMKPSDIDRIRDIIKNNNKIVAVGECGLDYDRMFSKKENQIEALKGHIDLAEELEKPMFLHERSASEDFLKIFEEHKAVCSRSVVHCFTGDEKTVRAYIELGFSIGITGWICDDRRADELRKAVRSIPLDRVLLETDAPYLTPRNVKGLSRTNVPENIVYVARELAKYMGVSEEELIAHANMNTERLFGIS